LQQWKRRSRTSTMGLIEGISLRLEPLSVIAMHLKHRALDTCLVV
jgi:hypothetical protein